MFRLSTIDIVDSIAELAEIPAGKVLINTINAHSYNVAQKDGAFAESLTPTPLLLTTEGRLPADFPKDEEHCRKYLLPDGASIVKACRWLKAKSQPKERIAGWDLFAFEMERLERRSSACRTEGGKPLRVMFMGSSEKVLAIIRQKAAADYPNLEVVTYSPPYKAEFSEEDNRNIVKAINETQPDLLWIGMTAPKQEKWTYQHWEELHINCHVGTIGAVFDFYAGTARRAPRWWQRHGLEWLYRLTIEPKRMWKRYVVGNPLFIWNILKEKCG